MYALGIDLGATNLKIGIVNDKGVVLRARSFPLSSLSVRTPRVFFTMLSRIVRDDFIAHCAKKIACIGIGLPGLIDYQKGVVHYLVNIRGWREVPVARYLSSSLRVPVFVDNDVNMMAFGEYCYGAGRHSRNLFCMTLGTGVGGAFIIDGAMYRGKSFSAGEVGHIPLNEKGPRCPCGGKACLERYVGNKEIARLAHAAYGKVLPANVRRALTQEKSSEITPRALARLAREGDAKARKLWFRIGGFIGLGLVTIVNLYNPDTIVIGGGVAGAGKFLFDPIRRTIAQRAMRLPGKVVSIKKAKLAEDAGIIGAAACAMNALRKKYMKRPS